ncbi:MAG: ATP-binding protein [Pseudobdellovibrionaceae bacterium]
MQILKGTDRDKYFQFICLFLSVTAFVYGAGMIYFSFPLVSAITYGGCLFFGLIYWLHFKSQSEHLKTIFFCFSYLIVASSTFYFGTESGVGAWFITIGCLGLALFPVADHRSLPALLLTTTILTVVYSLAPRQGAITDPEVLRIFRLCMIPLSVGSALISIYAIQRINFKIEKMASDGYEKMDALVNALNDIVFQLSPDLKYMNVWVADESKLLKPREQLIGKSLSELVPEDIFEKTRYNLELSKKMKVPTEFEYTLQISGKVLYFRARAQCVFSKDDQVQSYLASVTDVTEQTLLRMELEVKRSQMIQSAKLSSLGEMAAGIAHEINNPLAIISAQAERIATKAEKNDLERDFIIEKSRKIIQTVGRIAAIVRGMRNLSRNSERDQESIENLTQICLEAISLSHDRIKNRNIELVFDLPEILPISCKPAEIGQVVINLISNAIDAIDALSEVNSPRVLRMAGRIEDRTVFLDVCDSGPGISALHVEKIMEPFFTTKEIGKGTGLGLSVAKGITEKFRGQLVLKSLSHPTIFSLRLPLAELETSPSFEEPLA